MTASQGIFRAILSICPTAIELNVLEDSTKPSDLMECLHKVLEVHLSLPSVISSHLNVTNEVDEKGNTNVRIHILHHVTNVGTEKPAKSGRHWKFYHPKCPN